jgi:chemotaxis protein histidine kinase CheA
VSDRVDLAEFLSAYVAETDEQLTAANARLLGIEAALRKNETSPRAVRDLFRALHTIKGLSAMVGVEAIVTIAHKMESVLRAADRAGGVLASAAVDTMLEGVRAIEQRVRAHSFQLARELRASFASPRSSRASSRRSRSTSSSPHRGKGEGRSAWTSLRRPSEPRQGSPSTACASGSPPSRTS